VKWQGKSKEKSSEPGSSLGSHHAPIGIGLKEKTWILAEEERNNIDRRNLKDRHGESGGVLYQSWGKRKAVRRHMFVQKQNTEVNSLFKSDSASAGVMLTKEDEDEEGKRRKRGR